MTTWGATRLLDGGEVRRLIPMADAIDAMRTAFRDLAAGAFALPPRLVLGETVLVMVAHHLPTRTAVVKTVSVELDRTPAILGTLVWTSPGTQLVAEATAITALRTGAIVGAATDALADPHADTLALIGTGAQAADQARAVHAVRPLRTLAIFGRDRQRATAFRADLARELPDVDVQLAPTIEVALADAEIVCCATSTSTPLFPVHALRERVHVNAIGSFRPNMRELPEKLLETAELVVVDQVPAAIAEAGEVIAALDSGAIRPADLRDLASVLDTKPVSSGRTVFKSVGVAIQDWAIARLLHERSAANRGDLAETGIVCYTSDMVSPETRQ